MTRTQQYHQLWKEARTRLNQLLPTIATATLQNKIGAAPNSVGFLLQHLAEVELLFAKNVFGNAAVRVVAKTVIEGKDSGIWTDLEAIKQLLDHAEVTLGATILEQDPRQWDTTITSKEFGTKTKAEALGRIVSHSAYHAGQIALAIKYGTI